MKTIFKIIKIILILIFFAFAISMSVLLLNMNKEFRVTQFGETSLIIIDDEISSDKYKEGDLVLVDKKPLSKTNVGDEIFVFQIQEDNVVTIELGNVGSVYEDEDAISMENGAMYSSKFIAGHETGVYEGLGTYINILQSTWVFFFVIVVPCFLIFIYQIYSLVVEIKFGSEEPKKSSSSW